MVMGRRMSLERWKHHSASLDQNIRCPVSSEPGKMSASVDPGCPVSNGVLRCTGYTTRRWRAPACRSMMGRQNMGSWNKHIMLKWKHLKIFCSKLLILSESRELQNVTKTSWTRVGVGIQMVEVVWTLCWDVNGNYLPDLIVCTRHNSWGYIWQ